MPDTPYLDSGLQTGFSDTDLFQLKLENMNNFDKIINQQPYLTGKFDFYQPDPSTPDRIDDTQKIIDDINANRTNFSDYLTHPDKRIRDVANGMVFKKIGNDPFYKKNVGGTQTAPYEESMDKYLDKDFGYRTDRDNEDYYYRNSYLNNGWFMRNIVKNPARFVGRVVVPAVLKMGEGLGYVGSMLTSVGSDNYWADVADNGMSNWLEGLEQKYKDQVIPVYKQAGFDDKGFFNKLLDWSFWNDSVADGVAFMASAAIPAMGLAKLGTLGTFGESIFGNTMSKIGLGSMAEVTAWTFNTAMEASQEGSQVFKEMKRRLELERAQGLNSLTDQDIKERAGTLAGNTVAGNFAILGISNAFENTLFFKPFKHIETRAAVQLTEDLTAKSAALEGLTKANPFASGLSRTSFYGARAFTGLVAEGLWEENAQLALQRMNQGDTHGRNFFEQLGKQTIDAFTGKDKEASESIGIGALIGMGASTVLSKASNERRKIIENTQKLIDAANEARHNLFSVNDIYEKGDDGNIVFDDNTPRVDPKKMAVKQKELENIYGKFSLTNLDEYYKSHQIQYQAKSALADYVRSMSNLGIEGISQKMREISPKTAPMFGMNPTDIKNQTGDFASLAESFEHISKDVDALPAGRIPLNNEDRKNYDKHEVMRKSTIYDKRVSSVILSQFVAEENSKLLRALNEFRNLSNASISQYPVDLLNSLIYQKRLNEEVINSEPFKAMSDFEKSYHQSRDEELSTQIENYKDSNELALQDSKKSPSGYYTPTVKNADGSVTEVKFDTQSARSQQKAADYNNIIDKNYWIATQLSGDHGHENFLKLKDTPLQRAMQQAAAQATTSKPQFIEKTPGDFDKLLDHVKRTLFSEDYTPTAETQALIQKYPEMVSTLLTQYQKAAENSRQQVLNRKLDALRTQQQVLGNQIDSYRDKLEDKKTELQILREELGMVVNKKPVDQRRIAKSINLLEKDIAKVEEWFDKQQKKAIDLDNQISTLQQEIESGNLVGLRNALQELRQERDWIRNKVSETKTLVDRLKKLIQDIRRIAYKLFGTKSEFERNLEKGRHEAVEYATEIEQQKTAWQDAKDTLIQLNTVATAIEAQYAANKAELEEIIKNANKFFKDQYTILTQKPTSPEDIEEGAIEKGLTEDKTAFPIGQDSGGKTFPDDAGFDGNSYQRPLQTKFYTTTFPWIGEEGTVPSMTAAPQDVQDHAALLEFLTSSFTSTIAQKKLGMGKLRTIAVTKNNVIQLGLQNLLAERDPYFKIDDPAMTHVEVIPVIEEGGYLYYIDTQLNRLGRVGEPVGTSAATQSTPQAEATRSAVEKDRATELDSLKLQFNNGGMSVEEYAVEEKEINDRHDEALAQLPPPATGSEKMVRRSLRTAKFTEAEQVQYAVKYTPEDMDTAIKGATDWRAKLLEITSKEPQHTFEFAITRGIPNKMRMEDNTPAKNPVVGTILPKGAVTGQTVKVFASPNQVVNGENITIPIGRPFIYTNSNLHEQLHAADNQPLTPTQVKTVTRIFQELLKDHLQKVQERINQSTTFPQNLKDAIAAVGGISNLDPQLKRQVFLKITSDPSTKGFNLFNSNYTNFLSGIVYFGPIIKDKGIGENQIYFRGYNMIFGNGGPSIDMTNPEEMVNQEVQNFLNSQNHNVKYFTRKEKAEATFIEYYLDNKDEVKPRSWKSYAEYMISPTFPSGVARTEIPITTAIKTEEQKNAEKNSEPYYPYESRAISLHLETAPTTITKKTAVKGKAKDQTEIVENTGGDLAQFIADEIFSYYGQKDNRAATKEPVQKEPEKREEESPLLNTVIDELENYYTGKRAQQSPIEEAPTTPAKPSAEEPTDDIPDYNDEDDEGLPPSPYEGNFRITGGGVFQTENDLDAVIADISRMVPQFNVVRLKRAIQISQGLEAWGQFVNNSIRLYEMAEKGTGYHEVFEAVANKLLTNAEWNALYREFNKRQGYFTDRETGNRVKYSEATPYQAKEQLAEEFMDYKLNETKPPTPNAKTFLQMIWDFMKWLVGKHSYRTIEDTFAKIEKGKFATRSVRSSDRFGNNFRLKILKDLPVKVKRDLYDGATSFMFQNIFYSPESLTQLDEIDLTDEQVYEPIRAQFQASLSRAEADSKRQSDEREKDKLTKSAQYIKYALGRWSEFVQGHKESIKHLRIKFEQEDAKSDEEKNNDNRNDYLQDIFKTDGKRSASKSVRFLFHTLLKLHFDKAGKTMDINGRSAGLTVRDLSSAYMASLVNYDSFMLKALEQLQGLNDFSKVEQKMRDLAGITEIEEMKNPEARAKMISTLDPEKATWTALYGRLFGFSDKIDEESAWNLRIKFSNYISKHSPEPYVFINGGGTSTIISSTKRSYFESITRKIETSLITNSNLVFRTMMEGSVKMFVPQPSLADVKVVDGKIVLTPKKIGPKDFVVNITKQAPLGKRVQDFVKFLGLDDIITPEFMRVLSRSDSAQLVDKLLTIRNALTEATAPSMSLRNLNIFGYSTNLIDFLDRKFGVSQKESQFSNIENQPQQRHIIPSFASRVIAEINSATNLQELHEKYPQTSTLFADDSIILSKMFNKDGERTDFQIGLGYMEGIKDLEDQEGSKTSRLEFLDKYYLQFNASLSGLYYSLPADSETEWVFNFGEFVSYSENMLKERGHEIITEMFLPKLRSEINMIIDNNSRLQQLLGKHPSATKEGAGSTIGQSLRFFKDILQYTPEGKTSSSLLNDIYGAINKGQSAEQIITSKKFQDRIINTIGFYLQHQTRATTDTLVDNRIVTEEGGAFYIQALNNAFVDKYSSAFTQEGGMVKLTREQLNSLAQYQKINTVLANMESFKILFGDPAQYKDFEKRAKSLFGPVEQSFVDNDGQFNTWLNENKNSATLVIKDENGRAASTESVAIPDNDIFNTQFSDKVTSRTIDDLVVVSVDTVNDLNRLGSEFAKRYIKDYEQSNEPDGQSIGTLQFARQLLIKSGWRWTKEHEAYFQYDTALMRRDMEKNGEYRYPNAALKKMDEKIIKYYEASPPAAAITPVKTLMPSVDEKGQQTLLKHSIHFISYQVAKEFELLDLYKDMLKRRDSVLNFKSAQKLGAEVDNSGKITPYYSDPFTKTDLVTAGNIQQELDFKTIGIQVETQSDKKGQTLGSQLTKDINLNLFENGIPTDWNPGDFTKSQLAEMWAVTDEDKRLEGSENYRKIMGERGTITTLENLKVKNTMDKFNELGIRWAYSPTTGFSTSVDDLRKTREYILSELQRLEVDQNAIDNIELTDDYKSFINPAETIPSYTTISNLLWSMADKAVTSFKVNGKPLVQVSSAFFNKSSRKAAIKNEDGTWTTLNTKEEYDAAVKAGKKPVMTSSELEFYKVGKDGKTIGMEIYLPHIYKKKVNDSRAKRGLAPLSDDELMSYLNKNPELLEGIGFRIPTQATSSLEFFRIKGFLPEIFGNAVVVPSAITTKAGSDFDVDKLNTYLNNWKLGKNGMPVYEEYATEEDDYRKNYEKSFLPKTSLLGFIEREYARTQTRGQQPGLTKVASQSLNSLIDNIFRNNIESVAESILEENEYPEGYTLQDLINDAKEEKDNMHMTFEQFMELPDFMRQTKGALENRYFQSIRSVLESPNMFEYLLSPNSIEHIRRNRNYVYDALGIQPEEGREIDYTKFLSTEYIAEKRNSFTKGKTDIGIFAIAMTNFANSQIAGIGINEEGGIKAQDSYVFDLLNKGDIYLPFPDLKMLNIQGKYVIPISALMDAEGSLTMDKLSSYINGAVDVAKEPLIIEMGMHTDLAGVYVLMERMGLTGKTTALFLYQPVIREFLKETLFLNNKTYFGSTPFDFQKDIIKYLVGKYTVGAKSEEEMYDNKYKFTDSQLAYLIGKGEKVKRGEAQWSDAEKNAQYQALVNFLKMRMFSQHLLETIQGSNHDTASIRSPYIIMKKDLQMDRSKAGNMIVKVTPDGVKNGTEVLRGETSIGTDVQLFKDFNILLSKMNLFALQKDNPRKTLENIAKRIYTQNPFVTNDDFVAAMREYESTMIDSLGNKVLVPGVKESQLDYNALYKYATQYFKTTSPNSLKKRLDRLKKIYPATFRKNFFLSNLEITTDQNLGIDVMELKDKPNNNEVVKKEMYTEAMLELAQYDESKWPELVQFYRAVVYGSFLQFGIKYSRRSFVDLIPVSTAATEEEARQSPLTLTDITRAALNNIDNEDFSNLDEQVQRGKWYKKGIVLEQKFMAVQFLSPNPAKPDEYILENAPVWRSGFSKPPNRISQIFFGRPDKEGNMEPFIHPIMVWAGYADNPRKFESMANIIKVPAIKPEFLVQKAENDQYGRTLISYQPAPIVYSMMKKGNYSFMFDQLFKKVGAENPMLGRSLISKANKAGLKSVNYLYKPINKTGAPIFNEILPVLTTSSGTTIGTKSILDFPSFKELEDNELVASINDKIGKLLPVVKPEITSTVRSFKPIHKAQMHDEGESNMETIAMTPENIIKVAQGTKTTTIRSPKQAGLIGIRTGEEGIRLIGGTPYLIKNRGNLSIQQAGGLEAILKSEGLDSVEALKFQQTRDWISGKGKLYVYDISPAPNQNIETPQSGNPTESTPQNWDEVRKGLVEDAKRSAESMNDVNRNMFELDPEGFLKFIAEQYWNMQGLRKAGTFEFSGGTGLDAYPDEIMDIAKKLFPKSDFINAEGKPAINPTC